MSVCVYVLNRNPPAKTREQNKFHKISFLFYQSLIREELNNKHPMYLSNIIGKRVDETNVNISQDDCLSDKESL